MWTLASTHSTTRRSRPQVAALVLLGASTLYAQPLTLPQMVERQRDNVSRSVFVDGGLVPLDTLLAKASLIVRASIADAKAQFTQDERDIFTNVHLKNVEILSSNEGTGRAAQQSDAALTIYQPGGTVRIGSLSASVTYSNVVALTPGMDVVLFLNWNNGQYRITDELSAFEVREGKVFCHSKSIADRARVNGVPVDQFISDVARSRRH